MNSSNFCGSLPGIWAMVGDFLGKKHDVEPDPPTSDQGNLALPTLPRTGLFSSASMAEKGEILPSPPPYTSANYCNEKTSSTGVQDIKADHLCQGTFFSLRSMGWFDPENYMCEKVWRTFKDTSRNKLRELFFTREDRPTFGENFKNASMHSRNNKHDRCSPGDECKKHPKAERKRRDRHRVLQRLTDEFMPTTIWKLASSLMPTVREELPLYYPGDFESSFTDVAYQAISTTEGRGANSRKNDSAKGKDEQLLSSAMFPAFAAIVVQSEIAHSEKLEMALEESMKKERYLEDLLADRDRTAWEKDALIEQQAARLRELLSREGVETLNASRSSAISRQYTPPLSVSPPLSKRSIDDDDEEMSTSIELFAPKRRQTGLAIPLRSRICSSPSPGL